MNDNNGEESLVSTLIKEVSGLGQQLGKLKDEEYECTFYRSSSLINLSLLYSHLILLDFQKIIFWVDFMSILWMKSVWCDFRVLRKK